MESVRFSGYRIFMSRSTGGPRCLITLVRATIPCSLIADPHCGDGVESLAVEIHLVGGGSSSCTMCTADQSARA